MAQGATEELIIGEIGHAVDKKLIDSNQRDNILMKKVKEQYSLISIRKYIRILETMKRIYSFSTVISVYLNIKERI